MNASAPPTTFGTFTGWMSARVIPAVAYSASSRGGMVFWLVKPSTTRLPLRSAIDLMGESLRTKRATRSGYRIAVARRLSYLRPVNCSMPSTATRSSSTFEIPNAYSPALTAGR